MWHGLSVCHDCDPCKNWWADRDDIWGVDSWKPKEPRIRQGPTSVGKHTFGETLGYASLVYPDTQWSVRWQRAVTWPYANITTTTTTTTILCPGLPMWVGTRRIDHSGFCWSRLDRVAVASAEPYASYLHFSPEHNHASTSQTHSHLTTFFPGLPG